MKSCVYVRKRKREEEKKINLDLSPPTLKHYDSMCFYTNRTNLKHTDSHVQYWNILAISIWSPMT